MSSDFLTKHALHGTRVAMYIVGQEETVGESSVSSGCWGEDSDHKKWMGATYSHVCRAHSLFYHTFQQFHSTSRNRLTLAHKTRLHAGSSLPTAIHSQRTSVC